VPFRLGPLLGSACLVLAGCSGDDERPAVDTELRDGLAALYAGDHALPASGEAEGRCFADALLDRASTDELREAGLVDSAGAVPDAVPELDPEFAGVFVDAQLACTDLVEASTEAQFVLSKGSLDRTAYAACLTDALDDDAQREALVAAVSGQWDDPALATLSDAQSRCARSSGAG
jgi:hypothetical protein